MIPTRQNYTIKHRFTGATLWTGDAESLPGANLTKIRDDFWAVLCAQPAEVPALRAALIAGKIDGSTYEGSCACLVGTLANAAHCKFDGLPILNPDSARPAEVWFTTIRKGDTPETNAAAKVVLEWIDLWTSNMRVAVKAWAFEEIGGEK